MTKIICKRCNYGWDYKGKRTLYATCPNCKTTVRIQIFVSQEKNALKMKDEQILEVTDKYMSFVDFITEKNPLLMEEWINLNIKRVRKEADEILKTQGEQHGGVKPSAPHK